MWHTLLVVPLLSILIELYNTVAFGNLGVAVIEMTLLLRLVLLPLTIISEGDEVKYEKMEHEVEGIMTHFKTDQVQAHEEVRALLKKNKISTWAKTSVLLIQLLILVVLYQVFLSGINANLGGLWGWVSAPNLPINTDFFGFEIGTRSIWWAVACGVWIYLSVSSEQKKVMHLLGPRDAAFRYAFPVFTVVILFMLPMVKSLFILTTMAFSLIVTLIRRAIWRIDSTN
jgi:YidC/Oxa1 family membrane protein insertase